MPRSLLAALLAVSCASAPVKPAQVAAEEAKRDEGIPLSLDPHFACGKDRLRRDEADSTIKRARRSIEEVKRGPGGASDPSLTRLEGDLSSAIRNRAEADQALLDCEDRVAKERKERLALASTRPVRELRPIHEEERLPVEKERVRADDERLRAMLASDPAKLWGPAVSALLCAAEDSRALASEELSGLKAVKPKKRGKQPANPRAAELEGVIQRADEVVASLQLELQRVKAQRAGCDAPAVVALRECLPAKADGMHPAACDGVLVDDVVAAWDYHRVGERLKALEAGSVAPEAE